MIFQQNHLTVALPNEILTIPPELLALRPQGTPRPPPKKKSSKITSNNLEVVEKLQEKFSGYAGQVCTRGLVADLPKEKSNPKPPACKLRGEQQLFP